MGFNQNAADPKGSCLSQLFLNCLSKLKKNIYTDCCPENKASGDILIISAFCAGNFRIQFVYNFRKTNTDEQHILTFRVTPDFYRRVEPSTRV